LSNSQQREARVKVPEGQDPKAALPPDVRKGFEGVKKLAVMLSEAKHLHLSP
jgi:hypothetical protein